MPQDQSSLSPIDQAAAYLRLRQSLGTQEHVAKLLDVQRITIHRRETGSHPISRESWLALQMLHHTATH